MRNRKNASSYEPSRSQCIRRGKRIDELPAGIKKAVLDSADELSQRGFTDAQSMAKQILDKTHNFADIKGHL